MNPTQANSPTGLPSDSPVPLESVLCTEELHRRPSRPPDYQTECRALAALAKALADSPRTILQTLADTVLEVFKADSAGMSLLTTHDGGKHFYWPAIAGAWKPHVGGGTPRDFGPCGDVLDCNAPLLFKHFERRYPYLLPATPPAEEALLIPFSVRGKAVGTIWAMAHDDRRRFDAEDLRQLESLGRFASAAYQAVELWQAEDSRRAAALNLMEDAVQARQAAEKLNMKLRNSEERLSLAVYGTGMATWDVDLQTGKAIWSETHFRICGYEPVPGGEATAEMWRERIHPDDREGVQRAIEEAKRERTRYASEHRILRAGDGETRWLSAFGRFVYAEDGEAQRFVGIFHDITEGREAKELGHQATHDSLTGLANRAELERRLERVLAGADTRDPHALLYLDLDQFKLVNDTCGHAAGDALLRQLPAVLERPLRKRDTLARLGGDEFGVLLEHCPEEHALRIAKDLVQAIQEFPFAWEDKRFTVGASIGLVAIPEGGDTLAEVMSAADRACYAAKDKGRNRVHVYAASDEELRQRRGEMQWIPRLHRALAENRFRLYGQPVVALNDHGPEVEYSEVLLRLADEHAGLLLPGVFIPAAERYQQMRAVDRWVVRAALSNLAARGDAMRYGINVSAQSLCDADFLDFVLGQLDAAGVPSGQICFEITETAAITDLKHALRFMGAIKERGCRFALDDFGSGLASFGYLKTLPVDYLKIDGHFVKDIPEDPFDDAVVRAIQGIAETLGLRTIAESVESEAILERLRVIGVDYAQGYAIARPAPLPA